MEKVNAARDLKPKQDVIKKVVAYMTLGVDVAPLFSSMVIASNTKDLVIKKMVYFFLTNYARTNPDLTLLTINTLQKDCRDEDPVVRGLALRSLCSLGLPSIIEYVIAPLQASMEDESPYVRKTGALGVLKVHHLGSKSVDEAGLLDNLRSMLRDRDPGVSMNALMALNEIMADQGGAPADASTIRLMLGRIKDFNDWGQVAVLDLVARYRPASPQETFDIMNLLELCLRVANSAVVLAAAKCFLSLTRGMPELRRPVYLRLRVPLLTMLTAMGKETGYVVISHIRMIVERAPGILNEEFKHFFCRHDDPTCTKLLKLEVLPLLADESNAADIVTELSEYVDPRERELSCAAVRAIGEIAVRLPVGAEAVVESLGGLLEMEQDWVRSQTVVVMRDLLRKYPSKAADVLPAVQRCLHTIRDPIGRAAVVWMFGEYGHLIDDAPYLLESLIDGDGGGDDDLLGEGSGSGAAAGGSTTEGEGMGGQGEESAANAEARLQLELLTATLKLFFKRPPEMQKMLGRLLQQSLDDSAAAEVRDRALLYFRLLRQGVPQAEAVVFGSKEAKEQLAHGEFLPEVSDEVRD